MAEEPRVERVLRPVGSEPGACRSRCWAAGGGWLVRWVRKVVTESKRGAGAAEVGDMETEVRAREARRGRKGKRILAVGTERAGDGLAGRIIGRVKK